VNKAVTTDVIVLTSLALYDLTLGTMELGTIWQTFVWVWGISGNICLLNGLIFSTICELVG
jgi:hypothetical protein